MTDWESSEAERLMDNISKRLKGVVITSKDYKYLLRKIAQSFREGIQERQKNIIYKEWDEEYVEMIVGRFSEEAKVGYLAGLRLALHMNAIKKDPATNPFTGLKKAARVGHA